MHKYMIAIVLALCASAPIFAGTYSVKSPSGKLVLSVSTGHETTWKLTVNGCTVIDDSALSLDLGDRILGKDSKVTGRSSGQKTESIDAPFYRQRHFSSCYNYLTLKMKGGWALELRAYDDGVSYRYVTSFKDDVRVKGEKVEYRFADSFDMLVPFTRNRPSKDRYITSFENEYEALRSGDTSKEGDRLAFLPIYIDLHENGRLLLMESDLWDYPGMFLHATDKGFEAEFPPYPANVQVQDGKYLDYLVDTEGTRSYPWRIIAYAEDETGLPVNNMVYQTSSPSRLDDVSWITPGLSTWDWWSGNRLHGTDFKAGINTETYIYHIDFASKYGIPYILVDAGWYESNNMFRTVAGFDIRKICDYAKSKGVKVILWVSKGVLGLKPEKAFKHYSELGVAGFKIDYFDSQEAAMVNRLALYAEAAAKYRLVLDFHGIFKPSGLQRTWPNVLNFEGVFGLEQVKWAVPERTDMPRNDVMIPYIRMASGPMDYTPGALRNSTRSEFRALDKKPMSMGTRAHQLACYVCFDSPFGMLCDSPSDYIKNDETTRWIVSIPTTFDRTVIPDGRIGEYFVSAREKDGKWYVGVLDSWNERDLTLHFPFLPEGEWKYRMFADGVNADTVPEDYRVSSGIVNSTSCVDIHLAPGGGCVMILEKN